jgi:glycerophosphoryl diester phosphodiesterase
VGQGRTDGVPVDTRPLPVIVAHRGYATLYPENTIKALEAAVQAGASWVEVDVQLRADGVAVLAHDFDLTGGEPTLRQFAEWLAVSPVSAFIELKRESLEAFGRQRVLDACLDAMGGVGRWHFISFDYEVLKLAGGAVGWVLGAIDDTRLEMARRLPARWLFCHRDALTQGVPQGPWEVVVYEVATVAAAKAYLRAGIRWLETMNPGEIIDGLEDVK